MRFYTNEHTSKSSLKTNMYTKKKNYKIIYTTQYSNNFKFQKFVILLAGVFIENRNLLIYCITVLLNIHLHYFVILLPVPAFTSYPVIPYSTLPLFAAQTLFLYCQHRNGIVSLMNLE